ncbi:MAG: hypothetical protein JW990_01025, partial [Thermoleophilia bacterium]|nr:hypothetical protein [Thermoleophilia bacterium]
MINNNEAIISKPSAARRIAWWALVIMVFLVPVVMGDFTVPGLSTRLDFSSVQLVKLAVVQILTLVTLCAWAWDVLRRGGRIRHTPVDWLIIGFLVWVAITTFTSVHWPTALFGVFGRYEGLLTFATYALVYFLVLQLAETSAHVHRLAQSLFVSSLIVAIYGLLQYTGLVMVPEDLEWQIAGRVFSTYSNPVILGGFLIFSVTISLGLALHEQRRAWRLLYWVGFGLNGLALIVSFSRGAWMGAVVSVVLLSIMAWRQRVKMHRLDWIPGGACCLAAIGLLVRSLWSTAADTNVVERLSSIFQF